MNREERLLTFQRGAAALQSVLAADEAEFPDWREDSETLLFLRDVSGIQVRLQMVIDNLREAPDWGDGWVSVFALDTEDDVLERCERTLEVTGPYRASSNSQAAEHIQAIRSLRALLDRCGQGEFNGTDDPRTDHPADG